MYWKIFVYTQKICSCNLKMSFFSSLNFPSGFCSCNSIFATLKKNSSAWWSLKDSGSTVSEYAAGCILVTKLFIGVFVIYISVFASWIHIFQIEVLLLWSKSRKFDFSLVFCELFLRIILSILRSPHVIIFVQGLTKITLEYI